MSPTINYNAKSYYFDRVDVATGSVTERRLLTHWEASDYNYNNAQSHIDIRYVLSSDQYGPKKRKM